MFPLHSDYQEMKNLAAICIEDLMLAALPKQNMEQRLALAKGHFTEAEIARWKSMYWDTYQRGKAAADVSFPNPNAAHCRFVKL